MTDWLRKIVENVVPWLIENKAHRLVVFGLFWSATAFLALFFGVGDPVFAAIALGLPAALIVATRRVGMAGVPPALFAPALAAALIPAVFLGRYQRGDQHEFGPESAGLVLVGFLVFLVWVGAYPVMVDMYDQLHALSHIPEQARPKSLAKHERDPEAIRRLLMVKLSMATAAMVVAGGTYVVGAAVLGLLLRRRWTAAVALAASALSGFFSEQKFAWEFDPVGVIAGLIAAELWWQAYRHPLWDTRARRVPA
ncbi:hypothetical protein ACFPM7_25920 [Actinokineospora guangxiensis]|uniref:Uncharacterized protein n=1 Tax=Actinokineospora guangxiensis TaxID=1490288 RepID=A0ABW0EWK9_9PSEU